MHGRCSTLRRWRTSAAVVAACTLLVACEPAGTPSADEAEADAATEEDAALGAPVGGAPTSLAELREQASASALQWQETPVLASMAVDLDPEGGWNRATATYLAPEADRMYEHVVTPDGTTADRPTLATLGLEPVAGAALQQVPPPPEGLSEPDLLAEAAVPALESCGATGTPEGVLYATGAPVAWDGEQWTQPLGWTATVRTDAGGLVVLDPVTGEQLPGNSCVAGGEPPPTEGG